MKSQNLPDEHHVVRYVPHSRLDRDPSNDAPRGLLFTAFQRKEDEEGLSVTWMEYFSGDRKNQIHASVKAIRASNITVGAKSGFAIGKVAAIKKTCQEFKSKIRIIHFPELDNKAHSELRQFPRDDQTLLERLATESWSELILNREVPVGEEAAPDHPHVPT